MPESPTRTQSVAPNDALPALGVRAVRLSQLVGEFVADTEAAEQARKEGRPRGPVSGLRTLDEYLGGYLAPGVHLLQGAPGDGKTALALQVAASCQSAALYVSAEMPLLELLRRLIARETGTFLNKLKTGELGAREAERLALETARRLPNLALVDSTLGAVEPETIRILAEQLREVSGVGHVLVIVDSLQVWARGMTDEAGRPVGATEYDAINAGIKGACAVASRLRAPVLALSHRNRAGNNAKGATMHSGKGSGDLEYLAETVIDLKTEQDDPPDRNGERPAAAAILKNRHGAAGVSASLRFCGRLQAFREIDR